MTKPVFSRAAWGISCALRLCRTLDSAFGQIIRLNSIPLNPGLAKACVSFQAARLGVLAGIRPLNACHWARCRKTLHRFCGIATQPQGTAGEALHSKASPALSQLPERIWAISPGDAKFYSSNPKPRRFSHKLLGYWLRGLPNQSRSCGKSSLYAKSCGVAAIAVLPCKRRCNLAILF